MPQPPGKNKLPGITIPPRTGTKPTKETGEKAVFDKFVLAHPSLEQYASTIWSAAGRYGGITPTQLAAVIFLESGGSPTAKSKVGALGIAQIYDNTADATNAAGVPFFRANKNISTADKLNTAFAIQYAAWRLSGYASAYGGSIDSTYIRGYNPGYKPGVTGPANPISRLLPKGYVGTAATTVDQSAGKSVDTTDIEQGLKNPWVVGVTAQGKLKVVQSSVAPANVVMYDGTPMQVSDWDSLARNLESYFVSYTGGRPSNNVLLAYVQKGWSPFSLTVALAKTSSFTTSPIYKANAPTYTAAAQGLLRPGEVVPTNLIRTAIINNWDPSTFQAVLRSQPGYAQSSELQANTATLMNVHQSIMGIPDQNALNGIKQAALAGWTADQYAAWLRSRPEYVQSPEYQTKALTFLSALGLITGQQPVLKQGAVAPSMNPNPSVSGPLPTDSRLPAGSLSNPEDTEATF